MCAQQQRQRNRCLSAQKKCTYLPVECASTLHVRFFFCSFLLTAHIINHVRRSDVVCGGGGGGGKMRELAHPPPPPATKSGKRPPHPTFFFFWVNYPGFKLMTAGNNQKKKKKKKICSLLHVCGGGEGGWWLFRKRGELQYHIPTDYKHRARWVSTVKSQLRVGVVGGGDWRRLGGCRISSICVILHNNEHGRDAYAHLKIH